MITESNVRAAVDGAAWKAPSMRGYVKKTLLDESSHGAGAYKLTFVKADGTEKDFYFDNGTGVSATDLMLDVELLKHFLTMSWVSGDAASFEQVRDTIPKW